MTTEQKAKAYNKALEKAKCLLEDNPSDEGIRNWVKDFFPELMESEDERIRKVLLKDFSNHGCSLQYLQGITYGEVVAWLEKQKNIIEKYEDDLDRCACENFNKGYQKGVEVGKGKSTEWSKEDKKMLKSAIQQISIFEEYIDDGSFFTERAKQASKEVCCSVRNWLKSLSPQNHWKPTQQQLEALQFWGEKLGGSTGQTFGELLEELKKL